MQLERELAVAVVGRLVVVDGWKVGFALGLLGRFEVGFCVGLPVVGLSVLG